MLRTLIILCLLPLASVAFADADKGKKLHDENCMKCHDDSVYTRPNRFVTNEAALRKQVQRCQINLGIQWFDDDIEAVTNYLNKNYYKF
jgi:hypothetical protein